MVVRMKSRKKQCLLLFPVLCALLLCGSGWFLPAKMVLDTDAKKVYLDITAKKLIEAYDRDKKSIKNNNSHGCYAVWGTVDEVKRNTIFLTDEGNRSRTRVSCSTSSHAVADSFSKLRPGDRIKVFGKVTEGIGNKSLNIGIDKVLEIKDPDAEAGEGSYSMTEGNYTFRKSDLYRKNLSDKSVSYYIPRSWTGKDVEYRIEGDLGTIDGYQYRLDEISQKNPYAESFFVCCVNIEEFFAINDRGDTKLMEEAVIRDILGDVKIYPVKTVNTYYGPKYKYYQDGFTLSTGDRYQTEFVFQEIDEKRILMFLYVYNTLSKNNTNLNDVMSVMYFAEAK